MLGIPWIASIKEKAKETLDAAKVGTDLYEGISANIDGTNISYRTNRIVSISRRGNIINSIDAIGEKEKHIQRWCYIYALSEAILNNQGLSTIETEALSIELTRLHTRAEENSLRGQIRTRKYDTGLQVTIDEIVRSIKSKQSKCSFSDLALWLSKNATEEMETDNPNCDSLTYTEIFGVEYLSWVDRKGVQHQRALSSLKPYLKRAKTNLE